MTLCIIHESGTFWAQGDDVTSVVNAIESGEPVDVWWFAPHGQRWRESMWFDPERLIAVRTESDD